MEIMSERLKLLWVTLLIKMSLTNRRITANIYPNVNVPIISRSFMLKYKKVANDPITPSIESTVPRTWGQQN